MEDYYLAADAARNPGRAFTSEEAKREYRILCQIDDGERVVLVVKVKYRREVDD